MSERESLFPARAFPDSVDREFVWETLRMDVVDPARQETALQALDRIFDRYDEANEMLALCAADTTAVGLRQTIACIEAVLDRFAEVNAERENPSQMVTDLIKDVRYQFKDAPC